MTLHFHFFFPFLMKPIFDCYALSRIPQWAREWQHASPSSEMWNVDQKLSVCGLFFLLTTLYCLVFNFHCHVCFGCLHNPAVTPVIRMVYFFPASCICSVYFTELNKTNVDLNVYSQLCLLAVFSHDKTSVFFSLAFNQFLVHNRT